MSSASPFPDLPVCGVKFPSSPLLVAAFEYTKQHTSTATLNHSLRAACFSLIIGRSWPQFADTTLDHELIVFACITHDLGWATTKSLLSSDKRFEVDGANLARDFLRARAESGWDKHRIQLLWDAIALHTISSIVPHKEPEVFLTHVGIGADFAGPNFPSGAITEEMYKEVTASFPLAGFKDDLIQIMCGLCREKKETTFDNFVSEFGRVYGMDGKGEGKDEFIKECNEKSFVDFLVGGLTECEKLEATPKHVSQ